MRIATSWPVRRKDSTKLWVFLLVSSTLTCSLSLPAISLHAQEISTSENVLEPVLPATNSETNTATNLLEQIEQYSPDKLSLQQQEPLETVTSVSQLSDVRPTDWAYSALQNLAERYECLSAYPDGTYRGNRALTRYEFAAALNACLEQIQRQMNALDIDNDSDALNTLRLLTEEFSAELTLLRGRVDSIEARVAEVEANQFSTTTKLSGLAFFNITGASASDDVKVETIDLGAPLELRSAGRNSLTKEPIFQTEEDNPQITFSNLVWLTLQTSFTGEDSLTTQLAIANGNSPANTFVSSGFYNTYGVPFTDQSQAPTIGSQEVVLRELAYTVPVGDSFRVVVGPRVNWYRYFDGNAFTFFLNGASSFNAIGSPLLDTIKRGAGVVGLWNISDRLNLNFSYLGENMEFLPSQFFNTASDPTKGLFEATNTIAAQLSFSPSDTANIRLIYLLSNIAPNTPIFDENGNQTGTGIGATAGSIIGIADDGFGGSIATSTAHGFGINFDWLITPSLGIFGRYTYTTTGINPKTPGRSDGSINAQAFQFGVALPNLGKPGALGTVSFGIPFDVLEGRKYLVSGGGNGSTQYEIEGTYFLPLTDQIAVVPAFYVIANPNNFDDNPTIFVGNFRTQFSF